MSFFIITGLSGSGKSVALSSFEDLDYYCTDNLPASMLSSFAAELEKLGKGPSNAAVSIDSRNRQFLEMASAHMQELEATGVAVKVLFLEADEETILKRFNQTRRKHPLSSDTVSLPEAVQMEKRLLQPLAERADFRINTTNKTPYDLRRIMRDIAGAAGASSMTLMFESFGFKYGPPRDADFVFDVRCLPNPYWNKTLRDQTGKDAAVIAFFNENPEVAKMVEDIAGFMNQWLDLFEKESRSYITVAIGCTGGQHRSVFIADQLHQRMKNRNLRLQIRHREL